MSEEGEQLEQLRNPWLVAVWPGMGHVAINGGFYLMSKLEMRLFAEFDAEELFEVDHVEVEEGIIHPAELPRSRLFVWEDPLEQHDIVLFIGESQPPVGKHAFCRKIIEFAERLGVERVFTLAAMATNMRPEDNSRVFGAATDPERLEELKRLNLEILEDGHIGGLNGVLLGVAAERGLPGTCLLGEMPHVLAQVPYPKATLAALRVFTNITGQEVDLTELAEHADEMDEKLGELLARAEQEIARRARGEEEPEEQGFAIPQDEEEGMSQEDRQKIERLFELARQNKSKAYELKSELDRLGVFREYEDRFLDLFKKSGPSGAGEG